MIEVKINGQIKEFKTIQGAINYILHKEKQERNIVQIMSDHGNGD